MKKEYMTPVLSIDKVESVSPLLTISNENDWGQSKKGFLDGDDVEEGDDVQMPKNLWDD